MSAAKNMLMIKSRLEMCPVFEIGHNILELIICTWAAFQLDRLSNETGAIDKIFQNYIVVRNFGKNVFIQSLRDWFPAGFELIPLE